MAERFNLLPPQAVRETKRLMRSPQTAAIREAIIAEAQQFAVRVRSPEAREAFQAFFEKRAPDFSRLS
jgi:enoyl-CoA hydratase/carnithine racemase